MFKLVVLTVVLAAAANANVLGLGGVGLAGLGVAPLGLGGLGIAGPLGLGGIGLAGPIGLAGTVAPAPAPIAAAPLGLAYNYRGPVSLAPGQPANIIAADGRPLDTLSVNIDRAQHLTHRAVDASAHLLKKRSLVAPLVAPAATSWSHTTRVDVPAVGVHVAAPLTHAAVPVAHTGVVASPFINAGIVGPFGAVSPFGGIASIGAISPFGLGTLGRIW